MSEVPEIGGRKPIPVAVEAGKSYWWCACGRSTTQPSIKPSTAGPGRTSRSSEQGAAPIFERIALRMR